jgi:pimeloyl-ACP methyl ester carboxylesterase
MKTNFLTGNHVSIFYRQCGKGPFLFLLHPSPRNSKMMEPLMQLLQDSFTVIAPDLPGYGYSQPLPERADSVYDYVPYLNNFFRHFSDKPFHLYGTATGAQLAIAYALIHSQNIQHLYLDNTAHFSDEQCDEILVNYFPDFSPQVDGSHLQQLWQHVCDSCLFFPWYSKEEQNRIAKELPPPAIIQQIVNDYLLAGPNYADAYKVAFLHERAEKIQQLKSPTTIFKWLGSPILKYINALLQHPLPKNINIIETPVSVQERYLKMKRTMLQ